MRQVKVAATQMACGKEIGANIAHAEMLVRQAAAQGANIILLQELFETEYFCQVEDAAQYALATEVENNRAVCHFQGIAKELGVVLPISFYEKRNNARFNSVAILDADGTNLGVYRKSHIPDGPGYEEKFYFSPGDTGFKVWNTRFGRIGVGICWDQWFPESARCMAVMGAELLFYPTAIGSEPHDASVDSREHWQMCMQGHAASNLIPVIASNRIGSETARIASASTSGLTEESASHSCSASSITFYGSSFIAGPTGRKLDEADRVSETILIREFDLDQLAAQRAEWGLFRDRRPELYVPILTLDGEGG